MDEENNLTAAENEQEETAKDSGSEVVEELVCPNGVFVYNPKRYKKLSNVKKQEIAIRYYTENITQKDLAEQYGVGKNTVSAILRNPKWIKVAKDYYDSEFQKAESRKKAALLKAINEAPNLVDQLIKIASQEISGDNIKYQYVIQGAASDLLNRIGLRLAEEDNTNEITIKFKGDMFEPGMPMMDVTDSVPEEYQDGTDY